MSDQRKVPLDSPYAWAYAVRDGVIASMEEMKDDIFLPRLTKLSDGTYVVADSLGARSV